MQNGRRVSSVVGQFVVVLMATLCSASSVCAQTTTLVPAGATWKYLDNGSRLTAGWQSLTYDDSAWASGAAQLGYGDGDEATVVRDAQTPGGAKYITTYFRRTFTVPDPAAWQSLSLRLIRDDGAIVYLNGTEILRSNMPGGAVTGATTATAAVAGADESTWVLGAVDPALLIAGTNILAVEIHQSDSASSDISFDLQLGAAPPEPTRLVTAGAVWRYLDAGRIPAIGWQTTAFDDSTWLQGPAELGYGDGDEATIVSYGTSASRKAVTTYFRYRFPVSSPADFGALTLRLIRDDGAVVYLNGVEIYRTNLPATAISGSTLATTALAGADESTWVTAPIDPARLVAGVNAVAVEIHQATVDSTDISFNLELLATPGTTTGATLVRGPYLQQTSPGGVIIRWTTDVPTPGEVAFGANPLELSSAVSDPVMQTDHSVTLTGLSPATAYYYAIGTGSQRLAGGDEAYRFVTFPPVGTAASTRVWVLGDSGTADASAAGVRDAYSRWAGSRPTDLWLMLGDNAYDSGTAQEYDAAVFRTYQAMLRHAALWPALGNHDALSSNPRTQTGPYFQFFNLPTRGESGGVASQTESYYSFDYANVHFVVLDSSGSDRTSGGPMATWLQADLAATRQPWIIAAFHHPPYTKGSHDSDAETDLIEMRQNIIPILEAYGVDLVLGGHSHAYERSYLLDGHYGDSYSFVDAYKKDGGDGREDGTGAYRKALGEPHQGTVYVVAGSAGSVSTGGFDHPAMRIAIGELGSLVIDVNDLRLDVMFLNANAVRRDYFTILKGQPVAPAAPAGLVAVAASPSSVALSWIDLATNEAGYTIQRSSGGSEFVAIATVAASATRYADSSLSPTTTYAYRVQAFNATGVSDWSNTASVITLAPQAPAAPTGLAATARSATSVALSWIDNATDELGFEVQRSNDGVTFVTVGTSATSTTGYLDEGLSPATTYSYRVRAFNDAGPSAWSPTATATTPAPPPPSAPDALSASVRSSATIALTWSDRATDETAYEVQRSVDGVTFATIALPSAGSTGYVDTGLVAHTYYTYRVRAVRGNAVSEWSAKVRARTAARPAAPSGLTATAGPSPTVSLSWKDNSDEETGFEIQVSTDRVRYSTLTVAAAGTTTFNVSTLKAGTRYYFRVRALRDLLASGFSNVASATTAR